MTGVETSPPEGSCLVRHRNQSIIDPEPVWLNSDRNMSHDSLVRFACATLMTRSALIHCVIMAFARLSFLIQIRRFAVLAVSSDGIVSEPLTTPHILHFSNTFFIQTDQT